MQFALLVVGRQLGTARILTEAIRNLARFALRGHSERNNVVQRASIVSLRRVLILCFWSLYDTDFCSSGSCCRDYCMIFARTKAWSSTDCQSLIAVAAIR